MYCLFCLLRLGYISTRKTRFSEALWLSSRPNKLAIGLARERTHAVNTLLHAWVTPATVRALGATKSTHSARVKSQPRRAHLTMGRRRSPTRPSRTTTSSSRTASISQRSATWPTRARSRTTSRRTHGSRARRAFPSCSRGTPTAAASPSPCFPRDVRTQHITLEIPPPAPSAPAHKSRT